MSHLPIVLTVPFNGILVRYRASYHPKVSVEDGTIPPPPTFIGMTKRVWRQQGVEGLTRGSMPTILAATVFWPLMWFKMYISPSPSKFDGLVSSLFSALLYTILMVTTYRTIMTPRKLDILNAREALHVVFSAHERKKPWAIFQIPGLLPAILINLFIQFILAPLRDIILPWETQRNGSTEEYVIRTACLALLVLLSTVITAPLEVITTRLALQRNYGSPALVDGLPTTSDVDLAATAIVAQPAPVPAPPVSGSTPTEPLFEKVAFTVQKTADGVTVAPQPVVPNGTDEGDLESGPLSVNSNNVVVYTRSDNEPYTGLIDCGKKIIAEEGWPVLYRMWFLTFLGGYLF
ncbi:hypothetical protein C8R43DRAFT_981230 [Mycena crocata]|nr:hypothetical protein C8R43DRAFT_981230 [Mycena crocata]